MVVLNLGYGCYDFRINDAPRPGVCQVEPSSGTAFNTSFNVNCSVPFEDDDVPLTYQVGYLTTPTSDVTWIYEGAS